MLLFLFLGLLIVLLPKLQKKASIILTNISKPITYSLCIVLAIGIVSSSFIAKYQEWALLEVSYYLLIGLITFVVAGITYEDFEKVCHYVIVIILAVVSFYLFRICITYVLYQFGSFPLWPGTETSIGLFGFADKRFFNHIHTWTIPLLVGLGWYHWRYTTKKTISYVIPVLIIGWGILLLATGGRGTALSIAIGFLVITFLIREKWKFVRYNLGLTVGTIIGYYTFFKWLAGGRNPTVLRASSSGRLDAWINIIPDITSKPILGFGPMHYASINLNNWMSSPHNWLLQFAYEWGLIVAFVLLIVICVGLYSFANQIKRNLNSKSCSSKRKWIKLSLLWSLIAVFIHSFFSGLINSQLSQVWFILIVGYSMGIYYLEKERNIKNKSFNRMQFAIIGLTIFFFASLLNWGMKHPIDRKKSKNLFLKKVDDNILHPRFWQQGKIGLEDYHPKKKRNEQGREQLSIPSR